MAKDQITYIEHHIPAMHSGQYEIKVQQNLSYEQLYQYDTFDSNQAFAIAGNRFSLNPNQIHTLFPPKNSAGDHSHVLPHIVLKRSTLPWEWLSANRVTISENELSQKLGQADVSQIWNALIAYEWISLDMDTETASLNAVSERDQQLKLPDKAQVVIKDWEGKQWTKAIFADFLNHFAPDLSANDLWRDLLQHKWIVLNTTSTRATLTPKPFRKLGYVPTQAVQDIIQKYLSLEEKRVKTPWLALLVFDEDELQGETQLKMLDELKTADATTSWPGFSPEPFEKSDEQIRVIEVDQELLASILPNFNELRYLAHIRETEESSAESQEEFAVIMGNRLPASGKTTTVHLVSLQERFKFDSENLTFKFDFQGLQNQPKKVRVVSLKSWKFSCFDTKKTLQSVLANLNDYKEGWSDTYFPENTNVSHALRIAVPEDTPDQIKKYLSQGYVPLPHQMRQGSKTISWYKGPLATNLRQQSLADGIHQKDELVKSADQLYRFDRSSELPVFDVSYGAAWELGRLLMLKEKDLAMTLFQWKRKQRLRLRQAEQLLVYDYLPLAANEREEQELELPLEIKNWFENLRLLKSIPFRYLVPDERMLPQESIRFFQVDELWIEALLDGAFSIGRVPYKDQGTHKKDQVIMSGFFLRSEAVSGWPDLLVDGYGALPHPDNLDSEVALSSNKLQLLRKEKLSESLMICLFEGIIQTIDIHLKPEAIHFGFDDELDVNGVHTGNYTKILRDADGSEVEGGETFEIALRKNERYHRVLNLTGEMGITSVLKQKFTENEHTEFSKILKAMRAKADQEFPNPAQFAFQLIKGVPKVRFIAQRSVKEINLHPKFKDNKIIEDIYTKVLIIEIPEAEAYQFKLTQVDDLTNVLYESSKDHEFIFAGINVGGQVKNATYHVAVKIKQRGTWSNFTPVGELTLNCPYIDQKGHIHPNALVKQPLSSVNDWIYARKIPLVQGYRFKFVHTTTAEELPPYEVKGARFKLSSLGKQLIAGSYEVSVAMKFATGWSNYGESVQVEVI